MTRTPTVAATCTLGSWLRLPATSPALSRDSTADPAIVDEIVTYEEGLGIRAAVCVGSASRCLRPARAGPRTSRRSRRSSGPFDLYSAWIGITWALARRGPPIRKRAQIARGQELFNATNPERSQLQRVPQRRQQRQQRERHAVRHRSFARRSSANPGCRSTPCATRRRWRSARPPIQAALSGAGSGRTSTASRRRRSEDSALALPTSTTASRSTLEDVVVHYETALGFVYTKQERDDLVAFLEASDHGRPSTACTSIGLGLSRSRRGRLGSNSVLSSTLFRRASSTPERVGSAARDRDRFGPSRGPAASNKRSPPVAR